MRTAAISTALLSALSASTTVYATSVATFPGTLSCEPSLIAPQEAAFALPVTLKVEGNTVTWIRETQAMREMVSGTIVDGKVALEGYGGSVSAATRQAFWDWRLAAQLIYANGRFTGAAQLLSKDGRILQRRCTVVSLPSTGFVAPGTNTGSQRASSLPHGPAPTAPQATAPTIAPAAASEPSEPPTSATQPTGQADRAAPHEGQLSQREEALSRRERALARRERALAQQQQKKAAPATPAAPVKPPASAAQPSVQKTPSTAPALGDI